MRFPNFFKKTNTPTSEEATNTHLEENIEEDEAFEGITTGSKIKVVLALVVVGFAAYVAYWVQEPTPELKADILNPPAANQVEGDQIVPPPNDVAVQTPADQNSQNSNQEAVSIVNFQFTPPSIKIEKGKTIVWTNNDSVQHTVIGDNFSSGTINPGETFSHTFNDVGSFDYHCSFHPQMKGTVAVAAVSGTGGIVVPAPAPAPAPSPATPPAQTDSKASVDPATVPDVLKPAADSLAPAIDTASAATSDQNPDVYYSTAEAPVSTTFTTAGTSQLSTSKMNKLLKSGKLANSGPEDFLYVGVFGGILYLNRRRVMRAH